MVCSFSQSRGSHIGKPSQRGRVSGWAMLGTGVQGPAPALTAVGPAPASAATRAHCLCAYVAAVSLWRQHPFPCELPDPRPLAAPDTRCGPQCGPLVTVHHAEWKPG